MKTHVFPLDFIGGNGPILTARDPKLFEMVKQFCREHLAAMPDFMAYRKVWVSARVDTEGKPEKITGLTGFAMRVDVPIFRSLDGAAAKLLIDRINDYMADQGQLGEDVFVYIASDEPEDARCPNWQGWLAAKNAKPAERYKITVI